MIDMKRPENVAQKDNNVYTLGWIGRHNVVMAVLLCSGTRDGAGTN